MVFSEYIKNFPINDEDENVPAKFDVAIKDLPTFGGNIYYQTKTLPNVSMAELNRIRNIYNYLYEFQDVTLNRFFHMLKHQPKYKDVLKRYPNTSFEETVEELMEQGPKRFAEVIDTHTERRLGKEIAKERL